VVLGPGKHGGLGQARGGPAARHVGTRFNGGGTNSDYSGYSDSKKNSDNSGNSSSEQGGVSGDSSRQLLMFYEGVDAQGRHAIGLATSSERHPVAQRQKGARPGQGMGALCYSPGGRITRPGMQRLLAHLGGAFGRWELSDVLQWAGRRRRTMGLGGCIGGVGFQELEAPGDSFEPVEGLESLCIVFLRVDYSNSRSS